MGTPGMSHSIMYAKLLVKCHFPFVMELDERWKLKLKQFDFFSLDTGTCDEIRFLVVIINWFSHFFVLNFQKNLL